MKMMIKISILCLKSRLVPLLIALFVTLQVSCTSLSAQTTLENLVISINDGYLSINGVQAEMPVSIEWWVKQLGTFSRKEGIKRICYIWDDLGISLLQDLPENPDNIVIEFRDIATEPWEKVATSNDRGRDAIKNFPGTLIFNGIELDETVPLYEYNHRYRKLGGKKRFKQGSMSIKYYFPGLFFPGTKKTFDTSARVGEDNCIYRLEFTYSERKEWPTEEEVRESNRR